MRKLVMMVLWLAVSVVFATAVFAVVYRVSFQIINADTFEVITEGTLESSDVENGPGAAKTSVRKKLGFPMTKDERTVNGVKQRIIWGDIVKK